MQPVQNPIDLGTKFRPRSVVPLALHILTYSPTFLFLSLPLFTFTPNTLTPACFLPLALFTFLSSDYTFRFSP